MSPQTRARPRAFATATAVALIAIIGLGLTALTASFAGDVRRSLRQAADAQLRQLLIAGEAAVRNAAAAGEAKAGQPTNVPLPDELASAGMTLTYEPLRSEGDGELRVRITARSADGRSASQMVSYARQGERWELRSADL